MNQSDLEIAIDAAIDQNREFHKVINEQQHLCNEWYSRIDNTNNELQFEPELSEMLRKSIEKRESLFEKYINLLTAINWEDAINCGEATIQGKCKQLFDSHQHLIRMNETIQIAFSKLIPMVYGRIKFLTQSQSLSTVYAKKATDIFHSDSSRFFDQRR